MKTRTQPPRKATKKKPLTSDSEPETSIEPPQSEPELDPDVEHSNSQLSITLSTSYNPKEILCREYEKQTITKFVKACLASNGEEGSRVLYISGVPGIGKTVSTMQIINKLKKHISPRKTIFRYLNALTLSHPNKIYSLLNRQLFNPPKNDLQKNPALKLQEKLSSDPKIKIVIIDEVDYLYTRNQMVLYNLFEWSNIKETRLCLIIIANTMDFPERLQPKLVSRMGTNRLVFKPYSQTEVQKIIEDRLMKSNRFTKDAIQYACKKMSAFTSDVRKLLNILTRALQLYPQHPISMQEMTKTWHKYSQESGQLWQEYLPQFYRILMNIIKDHGGISTQYRIHERLCVQGKFVLGEVLYALREMEEMGILRVRERAKGGLKILEVMLLKI